MPNPTPKDAGDLNRTALLELAERVEQASGPDREADAKIAATLRLGATEWKWADSYPAWEGRADGLVYLEAGGPSFVAPAYTASLDATMTLVGDGFGSLIAGHYSDGRVGFVAVVTRPGRAESQAATPALALTAAALRSRARAATQQAPRKAVAGRRG